MIDIKIQWDALSNTISSNIIFKRISSESIIEIGIGKSESGNRCLILELPLDYVSEYSDMVIQNLTLYILESEGYIVLELTNDDFFDLFDDLIISIFTHVCSVNDIELCERIFI